MKWLSFKNEVASSKKPPRNGNVGSRTSICHCDPGLDQGEAISYFEHY